MDITPELLQADLDFHEKEVTPELVKCLGCGWIRERGPGAKAAFNAHVVASLFWAKPELTPELHDEAFKVALEHGLTKEWVFDSNKDYSTLPELPSGLVWVWLNGATPPHWTVRGTGLRL